VGMRSQPMVPCLCGVGLRVWAIAVGKRPEFDTYFTEDSNTGSACRS
jgi:hypothetical protein